MSTRRRLILFTHLLDVWYVSFTICVRLFKNDYRLVWIYSIRVAIYALAATDTKYRVLQ